MVTALGAPYAMREAMYYYAMRKGVERCSTLTALCKVTLMHGIGAVMTAGSWQGNVRPKALEGSAKELTSRVAAEQKQHQPNGGA